jgi:dihydroorotate dehydrogenase (fumarate)
MDLSTTYMGLKLKNPLVLSASPLSDQVDVVRRAEDAGASAVVMRSLFEEQLSHEAAQLDHYLSAGTDTFAESLTYFPAIEEYKLGPDEYLKHIAKLKSAVDIPIIPSLNGVTVGGWIDIATKVQEAGADALELNVYYIPTDPLMHSSEVEQRYVDVLAEVRRHVTIPVAVKLSAYFSSLASMAKRLEEAGANGLVLFNRFYQPDIDLEELEVVPNLILSTPHAMRLPMRWIAILYGQVGVSLAATSGIHTAEDVLKMVMVGADVTMLCSALLKNGVGRVAELLAGIKAWMEEHEYESVSQMKGSMSQRSCPNPAAFERANYMKSLYSYA